MVQPNLNVPSLEGLRKPRPVLRPKQLQTWTIELPVGNTFVAAHQILEQLKTLNRSVYPFKERIALLQVLRAVLHQTVNNLRQGLRQASLPLNSKNQYSADMLQQLLEHMATGYKLVIRELGSEEFNKLKEPERMSLTEACYFATVYLAQRLVEGYLVYAPAPAGIWRDLNQIYQFAEARNIHGSVVDEPFPDTPLPVQHTVDFAYKRIVLLALAEPYHLMEGEAEDMYRLIAPSATTCALEPMSLSIQDNAYVIDLTADVEPRYLSADAPWQAIDGRHIDISIIKQQLETHLQRILRANMHGPSRDATSLIERQYRDMLLRLADAWNGSLVRRITRFQIEGKVQLTAGINACHHYISGETEFTPAMDELRLLTHSHTAEVPDDTQSFFVTAYRDALQRDRKHNQQTYAVNPWSQRNISPIGIALNCEDIGHQLNARVGELVAYRFADKRSQRWRLGVVRWQQIQPNSQGRGETHIGIMNLATGAVPVGTKGIVGLGAGTDYFRSLFIPKQVALDQTRSLIVPAWMYDVNSILAVNMKNKLFHVRLTRMRLSSRNFAQFDFEIVNTPDNVTRL